MKNKLLMLSILFLMVSCNTKDSSSLKSEKSDDSINLSESTNGSTNSNISSLNGIKEKLKVLDKVVSKEKYKAEQTDNYSALDMEVKEEGETSLYKDNFVVQTFTQTINDSIEIVGRRERGISNNKFYQINYYGEEDEDNSVTYYENSEENKKAMFTLGYVSSYISSYIDPLIGLMSSSSDSNNKVILQTNFDSVVIPQNGKVDLQFIYTQYDPSGKIKNIEMNKLDHLVIEDYKITSLSSEYLYSLQDATNYRYIKTDTNFFYEPISEYKSEKLNPNDFSIISPQVV